MRLGSNPLARNTMGRTSMARTMYLSAMMASLAAADATFDMVASFQVLEHVWDLATHLTEAHRVLRPGGWLPLSTHGAWFYHPHPGDYRRWTGEGLRREIEAPGFGLLEMRPVVGPLAWERGDALLPPACR